MPGRQSRAPRARARESRCPRSACATGFRRARQRHPAASGDRCAVTEGSRDIVRASSPRLRRESGSAHSCIVSPKPFGDGGDQSGCRSCRNTTGAFGLTSLAPNARITAMNHSCGVRNFRESSRHTSGSSTSARATTLRSPSLERNARARRSTVAAGGSSLTKCGGELGRDEPRRGGMAAQRVNRALTFDDAVLVVALVEDSLAFPARAASRETRNRSDRSVPPARVARRHRVAGSPAAGVRQGRRSRRSSSR